jgi:HEPN domain-containing protein
MERKKDLVAEWLSKADDDLALAESALDRAAPICWAAAFHAQQAAEKCLKALLTWHEIEYGKTHDIGYLLDLCAQVNSAIESSCPEAAALTDYAVEPRYPLPARDATEGEARRAIRIAHQVRQAVRAALGLAT